MERSRSRREILVSSLLKALVESSGEFEFGEGHELQLKGLYCDLLPFGATKGEDGVPMPNPETHPGQPVGLSSMFKNMGFT